MTATAPSARARKTVGGHILLVQEERFRLLGDDGKGLLLTLAHNANVGAGELHRLHESNTRVEVEYTGEPNLVSGVAHRVRIA